MEYIVEIKSKSNEPSLVTTKFKEAMEELGAWENYQKEMSRRPFGLNFSSEEFLAEEGKWYISRTLLMSFIWKTSKIGLEYWSDIHTKLEKYHTPKPAAKNKPKK